MSVREIYETAFDSAVRPQDTDYLDDLAQSPLLCGSTVNFSNSTDNSTGSHFKTNADVHYRNKETAAEKNLFKQPNRYVSNSGSISRKTSGHYTGAHEYSTAYRNTNQWEKSKFGHSVSESKCLNEIHKYRKFQTEDFLQASTSTSGNYPPSVRPRSDPLDRRKKDSNLGQSNDDSSSSNHQVFQIPSQQSASSNSVSGGKTFSPSTEFKKLGVDDELKELQTASADIQESSAGKSDNEGTKQCEAIIENQCAISSVRNMEPIKNDTVVEPSSEKTKEPSDFNVSIARHVREDMKRNHSSMSAAKLRLHLDLSQPSKKPRHHFLDFWTPGHNAFHDQIDPTIELEEQGWYHGSINNKDAENALRLMQEGSFLVRCCTNAQKNYALSIKSANGVMHMKITQMPNGRYILKQQNQSFDSIPEMVHYFTANPLSVYGLEHVMLKKPVISQLL